MPAYSNAASEQAEGKRLFFAAFFSRKESAFPCLHTATLHQNRPKASSFSLQLSFFKKKARSPSSLLKYLSIEHNLERYGDEEGNEVGAGLSEYNAVEADERGEYEYDGDEEYALTAARKESRGHTEA